MSGGREQVPVVVCKHVHKGKRKELGDVSMLCIVRVCCGLCGAQGCAASGRSIRAEG